MVAPVKIGYRTTTRTRALLMLAADVAGYICVWPWLGGRRRKGRAVDVSTASRIAVFRLDGLGDLILSGPALIRLREHCPNAHITLFVNDWATDVAKLMPGPDEVVSLKAPFFKAFKGGRDKDAVRAEREKLKEIGKASPFDVTIDLRGDLLSIWPASWLGSSCLIARGSRAGGFLLSHVIHQKNEGLVSEVELNVRFVESILGMPEGAYPEASLATPERSHTGPGESDLLAGLDDRFLCMAVAAPYERRMYPVEKWREVITLIGERLGLRIVILGLASEGERCSAVAEGFEGVINLAGKLDLAATAECIRRSSGFVGSDGGLVHIASAYGIPLVQLFGPGSSTAFGHRGSNEIILQDACEFNACAETSCRRPARWCMDQLDPTQVAEAVLNLPISGGG